MDARKKDASIQCSILPLVSTNSTSDKDLQFDSAYATKNLRNLRDAKRICNNYSITQCKNQLRINKMRGEAEHEISHMNMIPMPIRSREGFSRYDYTLSSQSISKEYVESRHIKPDPVFIEHSSDIANVEGKSDPSSMLAPLNKVNNLQQLESLLVKVFKGDVLLVSDFQLSGPEIHILVEVLVRKNKNAAKLR